MHSCGPHNLLKALVNGRGTVGRMERGMRDIRLFIHVAKRRISAFGLRPPYTVSMRLSNA